MNKEPLIIIAGPTACGKTAVSIKLAKKISGEIISADSMQVYKYMDIGTAKVTPEEMEGIKHYLIDELMPDEEFSVAVFQRKAKKYITEICKKDKTPILVGGTGFYINALVYNNSFMSTNEDTTHREELQKLYEDKGADYIFDILRKVDPKSCEVIHKNNVKRVIRAIEYYRQTGEPISLHNEREKMREPSYDVKFFILNMDRQKLYDRIDKRIDIMLENGLVDEVKALLKSYSPTLVSMQGLGYKEIVSYLKGECSLDEAIYILKRDTRHFAKRQLTWFKHQCEGNWIDVDKFENADMIADEIYRQIKGDTNE